MATGRTQRPGRQEARRVKKYEAIQLLNDLLPTGKPSWSESYEREGEYHTYQFNFYEKEYYWNGKEIFLTAVEEWILYRWLVMGKKGGCAAVLFRVRKKVGADFLIEPQYGVFTHGQVKNRPKGRKSDLQKELEGTYYSRLFEKRQKGEMDA
jgi:hypothetical protein